MNDYLFIKWIDMIWFEGHFLSQKKFSLLSFLKVKTWVLFLIPFEKLINRLIYSTIFFMIPTENVFKLRLSDVT